MPRPTGADDVLPDAPAMRTPTLAAGMFGGPPERVSEMGAPAGRIIPPNPPKKRTKMKLGPVPNDATLGCSKCVQRKTGCTNCRLKAGLIPGETGPEGAWVWNNP